MLLGRLCEWRKSEHCVIVKAGESRQKPWMTLLKAFSLNLLVAASFLAPSTVFAQDRPCAIDSPCELPGKDGGTYHLVFPENWDGKQKLKPFVFFHGHNGSGKAVARNKNLARTVAKAGYVLVAPDGPEFTFRGRTTRGWAARLEGASPRGARDDIAFVERVLEDVSERIPTVSNSTVLSGFSSGGSMAWYVGCYSKRSYAAITAVAGGLRRPLPAPYGQDATGADLRKCPGGPRKMLHIHGFADGQVPLEGRGIRSWHQGDVFEGLSVQRTTNQCGSKPAKIETKGNLWCRDWTGCETGVPIRFCLHAGGHGTPSGWLDEALEWSK